MNQQIFQDYKAKRAFLDLYSMMEGETRLMFAMRVRQLASEKVETEDDSVTQFYITEEDVHKCFEETQIIPEEKSI